MLPNPLEEIARTLDDYNKRLSHLERLEGPGAWTLIEDIDLSATATTIDFQNIPATFAHLKILGMLRGDEVGRESRDLALRFNNDGGNNYDWTLVHHNPAHVDGVETFADTEARIAQLPMVDAPANSFVHIEIQIFDYAATDKHKNQRSVSYMLKETSAGDSRLTDSGARWRDTSAINRITLFPAAGAGEFIIGCRISLYGISA